MKIWRVLFFLLAGVAIDQGAETSYDKAVAHSQLGRDSEAVRLFRHALGDAVDPELRKKIHLELADTLKRLGRYREAASEFQAALQSPSLSREERDDIEGSRQFWASIQASPETVTFGSTVQQKGRRNPLGTWDIPVEMNGRAANWIFDTGASLSTLCESEARAMGLTVHESQATIAGSTGRKNSLRLAVAPALRVGPARLHNVVFIVVDDAALHVNAPNLSYQIRGIVGMPVLRALRFVAISANGDLTIDPRHHSDSHGRPPNMVFDGLALIVNAAHAGKPLRLFLDTGANKSSFYPAIHRVLSGDEQKRLATTAETTAGVGEVLQRQTERLRNFLLEIGGKSVNLESPTIQPQAAKGSDAYRDGVLGIDALNAGFELDFQAMQLCLNR